MPKMTKLCLHLLNLCRRKLWPLFFWTRCIRHVPLLLTHHSVPTLPLPKKGEGARDSWGRALHESLRRCVSPITGYCGQVIWDHSPLPGDSSHSIGGATPKFLGGPNPSLHLPLPSPLPFLPLSRFPPST